MTKPKQETMWMAFYKYGQEATLSIPPQWTRIALIDEMENIMGQKWGERYKPVKVQITEIQPKKGRGKG